jgi:hypothetical protein
MSQILLVRSLIIGNLFSFDVIIYVSLSHAGSLYYHIGLISRHLFYQIITCSQGLTNQQKGNGIYFIQPD